MDSRIEVGLVGHPFAPIGRGEDVRCSFRAFRSVGVRPRLIDVYGLNAPEPDTFTEVESFLSSSPCPINIFHINGDEVEQSLATLEHRAGPTKGFNIVYPAWELSRYPQEWAQQLNRFDEIWAPSRFIADALRETVSKPVVHMPLACEVILSSFHGRRWFGIPETAYAFLFFFDLRSYASRKNPDAVLAAFGKLMERKRFLNAVLVLKVNGAETAPAELELLKGRLQPYRDRVVLIDRTMSDTEVKNLVRTCDSFVSLHRSEGFGRGPAEAMYLGKPVIGTRYSGNLDFMDDSNSLLVDYTLIPLKPGEYPHWQGQMWADADVGQATRYMLELLDHPERGRELGRKAATAIRGRFGLRPSGLRYLDRLQTIRGDRTQSVAQEATVV